MVYPQPSRSHLPRPHHLVLNLEQKSGLRIHLVVAVGVGPHCPTGQEEDMSQFLIQEDHQAEGQEEAAAEVEEDLPLPEEEAAAESLLDLQEEDRLQHPCRFRQLNLL